MADSARFQVIMEGIDNGVADMTKNASDEMLAYISALAELGRKEDASNQTKALAEDFSKLTDEQKAAIIESDNLRQAQETLATQTEENAAANQTLGFSMSDLNAGMEVVSKALGYAKQAYAETIGVSMEYAQSVRELMAVTGESAENTSRLIQLTDDYQISSDDLTASMRVLTKNGLVPNKDTIIDLAKQYQAIEDPLKKNEFLVQNLGRASVGYTNLLSQNTDELEANFDAVNQNMILSEKQIKQAEQLRLAQDNLNDTLEGLKINIGTQATPAFSAWVGLLNKATSSTEDFNGMLGVLAQAYTGNLMPLMKAYGDIFNENTAIIDSQSVAVQNNESATLSKAEADKAATEAAAALSAEYTKILQNTMTLQGSYDTFTVSTNALKTEQEDLLNKIANTPAWETQKISEYQLKLDEIPVKMDEVQKKYSESMAKLAYDNYLAKASVDGLTDSEFAQAQAVGVSLGLFTQESANQAVALNNLTTALAKGSITTEQFNQAVKDGSFVVANANAAITESDVNKNAKLVTNADEAKAKFDEMSAKYNENAEVAKTSSESVVESSTNAANSVNDKMNEVNAALNSNVDNWASWRDSVSSYVNSAIDYINNLINAINEIPNVPTIGDARGFAGDTRGAAGAASGISTVHHVVDIRLNGQYIQSETLT